MRKAKPKKNIKIQLLPIDNLLCMCVLGDTILWETGTNRYSPQVGNQHTKLRISLKPILGNQWVWLGLLTGTGKTVRQLHHQRHAPQWVTKAVNPELMVPLAGWRVSSRQLCVGLRLLLVAGLTWKCFLAVLTFYITLGKEGPGKSNKFQWLPEAI